MGIYGQDWASYQPAEPSTSGLGFAIIKVTEGLGYVNPRWVSQRNAARDAGLVVGYYHYPHMGNSPEAEADRFLALADPQPGELVVLDWEGYDAANKGVSAAAQLAYKERWLRYVKAQVPHLPVGMYCNTDYWQRVDTTGYYADFLWIATAGRAAGDPGIRADWLIHQYGGDGDIDLDFCHLNSTDELRAWALAFATPEEDIVTPQDIQAIAAAVQQAVVPATAQAVWDHQVPVPRLQDDGTVNYAAQQAAVWPQIWGNVWTARILKAVAAQQAALATLITQLGAAHPGVDTATVVAAVQQAIADAVVHVDVNVQTPSPTNR